MAALRLLDHVREAARLRHLSPRTEKAYVGWIRRFVLFHGQRHPREKGAAEVRSFLSHLAVQRKVAAGRGRRSASVFCRNGSVSHSPSTSCACRRFTAEI